MGANTLVEAEIWTIAQTEQGHVILVRPKRSEVAVPIFVGTLEAQSILIGLGRVDMPRPLTHDLTLAIMGGLGAELLRIEIYDLRDGTYYARLICAGPAGELSFDARPSDAMALAVRCGAAVYIAESVVEEAGVPTDAIREASQISPIDGAEPSADATDAAGTGGEPAPGAPPGGSPADESPVDAERRALLSRLAEAVASEDYEEAARIRDRLNGLGA